MSDETEKPERFVIRAAHEAAEDEPCCDFATRREHLEKAIPDHESGELGPYVTTKGRETEGGFYLIDLESEAHKAWAERQALPVIYAGGDGKIRTRARGADETVDLPEDPRELAILICAIAASTPGLHGAYSEVEEALDVPSEIRFADSFSAHYDAWAVAFNDRHGASGDPEIDAEAHAALECERIREEAAEICAKMADIHARHGDGSNLTWYDFCKHWINDAPAGSPESLAAAMKTATVGYTRPAPGESYWVVMWAEAEAMIRTGWEP